MKETDLKHDHDGEAGVVYGHSAGEQQAGAALNFGDRGRDAGDRAGTERRRENDRERAHPTLPEHAVTIDAEARRGYRLQDEFDALFGTNRNDHVARVKGDYRETLSDLMVEDAWPRWWAKGRSRWSTSARRGPSSVSYTHLTLPTSDQCRSRWSPYH